MSHDQEESTFCSPERAPFVLQDALIRIMIGPMRYLDDLDRLDAGFFQISDREAASMDLQQRLLLEVVWEALEYAGVIVDDSCTSRVGVFLGCASHDYEILQLASGIGHDKS